MNPPIDIRPCDLKIVQDILHKYLPQEVEVWVFGSRATWTTKDSSDLDLAIDAGRPLTHNEEMSLQDAFEESDLPYKVDVVDMQTVSEHFKKIIEKDRVVLEWKETNISQYIKVQGGFAFKSIDFTKDGIPIIKIKNVKARYIDTSETDYVNEFVAKSAHNYFLNNGDIVISMTGSGPNAPNSLVGRIARYTRESGIYLINQRVGRFLIKDDRKVDRRFLFFLLSQKKVQDYLVSNSTGSANQANISNAQIENLRLEFPPLPQQKAIAHILGTLDDKIELNHQMSQTLQELAQAVFKSWFIDFDPVHAKAEGCSTGLPPELNDLFPDQFVDSELGKIPRGWKIETLGNIADVNWGDTKVTKSSYISKGYAAYSASGQDGYLPYADFNSSAVVLSAIGANSGQTWLAKGQWSCIKNTIWLQPSSLEVSIEYLYVATGSKDFWPKRGSAQPFIAQADARNCRLILPNNNLASIYGTFTSKYFDIMHHKRLENKYLSDIRDTLLPKLLSGELLISDAEQFLKDREI